MAVDKCEVVTEKAPSVLTISADELMVHCDGAWSEMKCGSFISKEYGRSTIGTMERAEGFGELLYLEAMRRDLNNTVVFVEDGATWIWNLTGHHFSNAADIVNWYHAPQHLWEVAHAWYGDGKKADAWVKNNKTKAYGRWSVSCDFVDKAMEAGR